MKPSQPGAVPARRRWRWYVLLALILLGVGAAAITVWSAEQQAAAAVAEVQALPAGDAAGYLKGHPARANLMKRFPFVREQVQAAEGAWLERSTAHWEGELARLPAGDFSGMEQLRTSSTSVVSASQEARLEAAETAWFERTYHAMSPGDWAAAGRARASARKTGPWKADVRAWEAEWAGRTVDAVLAEVRPLLGDDPARASARLQQAARDLAPFGQYRVAQEKLTRARRQALRGCLDAAVRRARALLAQDRFREAADVAARLEMDHSAEAKAVGAEDELNRFRDTTGFLADLARRAAGPETK
jgi:hypothetical protein